HGSCGMGFGSTIERHENSPTKLFAQDLQFPEIVAIKLRAIRQYYQEKALKQGFTEFAELPHEQEDSRFINYTLDLQSLKEKGVLLWVNEQEVFSEHTTFEHFIFEGAQGILLDMDFGFFPNVTRSNTSSKNALQLIKRNNLIFEKIDLWYVSRAYHTRHGAGWFPLEQHPLVLINTEKETNQLNDYQGFFRKAPLHIDLVRYALEIDNSFSKDFSKNIIITCTDQIPDNQLFVFKEQKLQHTKLEHLPNLLEHHFSKVLFSKNDYSEGLLD
ncbi:MAG: adenylosuccinate synthetase, partial [Thermonemataceae bacterium]|nr:adenylosuccinate synthetase [Thermonemataceae bacterium]